MTPEEQREERIDKMISADIDKHGNGNMPLYLAARAIFQSMPPLHRAALGFAIDGLPPGDRDTSDVTHTGANIVMAALSVFCAHVLEDQDDTTLLILSGLGNDGSYQN